MNKNSEHNVYEALVHTEKSLFKVYPGDKIKSRKIFNKGSSGSKAQNDDY